MHRHPEVPALADLEVNCVRISARRLFFPDSLLRDEGELSLVIPGKRRCATQPGTQVSTPLELSKLKLRMYLGPG